MKKLLLSLLFVPMFAAAQENTNPSLDMGGVLDFVATSAKSARGGTAASLDAKLEGIAYLPVRRLFSQDKTVEYAHIGAGAGMFKDGQKVKGEPLVIALVNAPCLAHRLTARWGWYQGHVVETALPDIFVGPLIKLPVPGVAWTWKTAVGGALSIGLGGGK